MRTVSSILGRFDPVEPTLCWIEWSEQYGMRQVPSTRESLVSALSLAKDDEITLHLVWPGKSRSDMFRVDDPESLLELLGAHSASLPLDFAICGHEDVDTANRIVTCVLARNHTHQHEYGEI